MNERAPLEGGLIPSQIKNISKLDRETQKRVTDLAISTFGNILSEQKNYAVFASTALYLHGKRLKDREVEVGNTFDVPPGDFDVTVFSEKDLFDIRDRLGRDERVQFQNNGQPILFPDKETKVISGTINLEVETKNGRVRVPYEFEFFLNTRIVSKNATRESIEINGLRVLTLDGLLAQYAKNLELETRVDREVQAVTKLLVQLTRKEVLEKHSEILSLLRLTEKDLDLFYQIQKRLTELEGANTTELTLKESLRQSLISQRATVLSGLKTKIPKRLANIEVIQSLLQRSHTED